jgi:hypothetical protein
VVVSRFASRAHGLEDGSDGVHERGLPQVAQRAGARGDPSAQRRPRSTCISTGSVLTGPLAATGLAVSVEADVQASARFARWLRSIVPQHTATRLLQRGLYGRRPADRRDHRGAAHTAVPGPLMAHRPPTRVRAAAKSRTPGSDERLTESHPPGEDSQPFPVSGPRFERTESGQPSRPHWVVHRTKRGRMLLTGL